jgi:hypothetical protein
MTAVSFGVAADDWHVLQTARPNVLLIGTDAAVDGFLELLRPRFLPPIIEVACSRFSLPAPSPATLILREIPGLDAAGQQQLFAWMSGSDRRIQVVSTSPCPLYPLVERQQLDASLYYSLNVLMIAVHDPVG